MLDPTHLTDRSVVHKVLVEVRLAELSSVVRIRKLEDREAVLLGERLKDVSEVGGLGLRGDAESVRSIARETGDGVHALSLIHI